MDWVIILLSFVGAGIFAWAIVSHYKAIHQRMMILRILAIEAEFEALMEEFDKVPTEKHIIYVFFCRDVKSLYPETIQEILDLWDES